MPVKAALLGRAQATSVLAATLLAALVLLPRLGHHALAEWDEAIYAEVAREMRQFGWLVPHWNGVLWFEKPPLSLWMTAVLFRVLGPTTLAARLGAASAGVATVALLHGFLRRRADGLTAWLGTFFLLSAFGFQHVCRAGETDAPLTLFCLVGVIGLAKVGAEEQAGWMWFLTGLAGATMTKGAGAVVLVLAAGALAGLERWRWSQMGRPFGRGLLVFLMMVLPWHLYMLARFGGGFARMYFGFHTLARATGAIEGHVTYPWFYLWVLLVSAPPFALGYPAAVWRGLRRPHVYGMRGFREQRTFAVFALVVVLFYSVVRTRLPHYIAPAYPALAAVTAAWVAGWVRARPWWIAGRGRWVLAGSLIVLLGVGALTTAGARGRLHSARMAKGVTTPANAEAVALLEEGRDEVRGVPGPLLLWRAGPAVPLTSSIFYARRPAVQVSITGVPAALPRDPYVDDPMALRVAAAAGERVLLVESALLPTLPADLRYRRLRAGTTMELGLVGPATSRVNAEAPLR